MLIDFTVENFRSYREPKRLSLVASAAHELPENIKSLPDHGIDLLGSAAVYGANASGKSNLLAAMHLLGELIDSPTNRPVSYRISISPFALDIASAQNPSSFKVRFVAEGVVYEYLLSLRSDAIAQERLSAFPLGREQVWFQRVSGSEIVFGPHLKGPKQSLVQVTATDVPFLAVAAAFEHRQLSIPAHWIISNFRNRINHRPSGWFRRPFRDEEVSARLFHKDESFRKWASEFLRYADVVDGIDVEVTTETIVRPVATRSETGELVKSSRELKEHHYEPYFFQAGDAGVIAKFGLADQSLGTRRLFAMLAPFYEVLRNGQLAVIDELSASLHPSMVREIVRLFHNSKTNRDGAQLVFATHDTTLLTGRLLRRDQIWLTEKGKSGATDLYSLNDIRGVRDTEAFEKGYLRGRYGAIPFFGRFDFPEIPEGQEGSEETLGQPPE